MDNNKRSGQYDWFKGNNNPQNKKNKSSLKTTWKFTKILIYLSLFVFTMTGCVQSFVIKTNNKVGNGVEFYNAESKVSPHVTKFNISTQKVDTPERKNSTQNQVDIYSMKIDAKRPVWVNDQKTLKLVRDELIKNQGVIKLSDAFKGGNEAISIQGNAVQNPKDWDNAHSIEKINGIVATWSTESQKAPSVIRNAQNNVENLGSSQGTKYLWTGSESYKLDLNFFAASNDNNLDANNKMSLMAINTILAKPLSHDGGLTTETVFDFLNKHLSDAPITSSKFNTGSSIAQRIAAEQMLISIFKYAGVKVIPPSPSVSGATLMQITYTNDFVPGIGFSGSSSYRPMVKWGDAWKRGPFYGIFVYPIANIASHMVEGMGDMNGWEMVLTIFLVVWATRALTFALSFKSILQQAKMQELNGKKAVIDAKYAAYKGNKQMEMRKNQEVQELYKKEGVSALGSFASILLTMPFFLALWRVIGAIPHLKSGIWAGISFPATSWRELFAGQWQYLFLIVTAALFAAGQQIVPRLLTKKRDNTRINVQQKAAMKKNNKTQNIMMIVFVAMAVIFNAGLQIYWIAGGLWVILQSVATHHYFVWQSKRKRRLKIKA